MARVQFPSWNSWDEMLRDFERFVPQATLNNVGTKVPTYYVGAPDIFGAMRQLYTVESAKAKSAVVNDYITPVLKSLTPFHINYWMLNSKLFDMAIGWFNGPQANQIKALFTASADKTNCTAAELQIYTTACKQFRQTLYPVLGAISVYFASPTDPVPQDVPVDRSVAAGLQEILTSIITKENIRFGNARNTAAGREPPHYQNFKSYLLTGMHDGIIPLFARRASGQGYDINPEGIVVAYQPMNDNDKTGALLLTTALMHHLTTVANVETTLNRFRSNTGDQWKAIKIALVEYEAHERGENVLGQAIQPRRSGYIQQLANIDIIFNFYLWCSVCGVSRPDRLGINTFLYLLGRKILGAHKVIAAFNTTTCAIGKLKKYFNRTGSIYTPPYAITPRRAYDMVAVFGAIKADDLPVTIKDPGVSTRYLAHLKLNNGAMRFIVNYWRLERAANTGTEIMESEHMFHELLINRLCAYENSNFRPVFRISFRPIGAAPAAAAAASPQPPAAGQQPGNAQGVPVAPNAKAQTQ